ncbi:MBL fold metallo-hydrolase [Rhodohalobacter mucosus]|uniref:MBL fold metallo-hydrolase n=1 Tax=Rhodohalobacter mucosus TaxID=2079485 RepID=A0A316TLL4_9BACT|nr:MBL fold metallo-hydrolase [Rhodohalobacter mucosus]
MDIELYTVGPFAENTYLISQQGSSLLIDPGFYQPREYSVFQDDLAESGNKLTAVILTHAHVDHVLGLEKVLKNHKVPVYLNHSDLYLWNHFSDQAGRFGFSVPDFDFTPEPLDEQEGFTIGSFSMDVICTPGHSPDHVSIYFPSEDLLIAGDALFRESIGRTDLYKGDFDLLSDSIRNKLYTLPDSTRVLPGHGPATTIGYEKKNNAFVKGE